MPTESTEQVTELLKIVTFHNCVKTGSCFAKPEETLKRQCNQFKTVSYAELQEV